jgi:hypothetical protein
MNKKIKEGTKKTKQETWNEKKYFSNGECEMIGFTKIYNP